MTRNYSIAEILQIAVQIEKNGKDFYEELVNLSYDEQAIKVFTYLAQEEERHIAVFKKLLDSVQTYDQQEVYPDEYFSYLNKLASEHVFTQENKGKEAAKGIEDPVDAVDLGIKFEEESISLFQAMKKVVSKDSQNVIDILIMQEQKHLKDLSNLKDVLE